MCLEKVTKVYNPPIKEEKIGYKIVEVVGDHVYGTILSCKFNKWLEAVIENVRGEVDGSEYKTGFHILKTRQDARNFRHHYSNICTYKIVKVKYRDITVEGEQWGSKVVIANKMLVLRPEKKKARKANASA